MIAATGAGRTAFVQSISHLVDLGLLERNPGHGHPLRPEFRLTRDGLAAGDMAAHVLTIGQEDGAPDLLRRMWTIPVLAVCQEPRYFSDIRTDLAPVTDRALSQTLKNLHARNWLQRNTDASLHPPRPAYMATNAGVAIGRAAQVLTR
ncbi:helix-turn-helix domain-containing protein [uncultured Roseobacter sp.]|uniref:winged helix-turn-helix transcriptional regulator n=1 Tax=uncultured Roseobacter sp. TaxID=114847 RepID=UPI0026192541|nr:winged helix-turn-helix transcriptional regulator [uncultured Roseobacter sp.]